MDVGQPRAAIWGIWAMIAAFAVVQGVAWMTAGGIPRRPGVVAQVVAAWLVMLVLGVVSTRLISALSRSLSKERHDLRAAADEVQQLQIHNDILQVLARTLDVPLAFQALARGIARLVACDRVGLALLSEDGAEFQTYTARVREEERRNRPRPEVVFKSDRTAMGQVVRSRAPLLIPDTRSAAQEFFDINVLHSAGFNSALVLPLAAKGRVAGTINFVARQRAAFRQQDIQVLLPIAEMLAVAHVTHQTHDAAGKYRLMEAMSELTLSLATDINGALQTIVGHCNVMEREYADPAIRRDVATIVQQSHRISVLLEKMRVTAHERLKQVAETVNQAGIPSSPEAFPERGQDHSKL